MGKFDYMKEYCSSTITKTITLFDSNVFLFFENKITVENKKYPD